VSSYLRIDGEEIALVAARLMWSRGSCDGRRGIAFKITAHGARRMLHLAAWAPAVRIEELSGQTVPLAASGPDAAVDGRFFASAELRFGRVRDDRAVLSLDGEVEALDPASSARATVEADIRCTVTPVAERRHCLSCGRPVDDFAEDVDEFVGGYRVRSRVLPTLCPDCQGFSAPPRYCPTCGVAYEPDDVEALSDEGSLSYTARCPGGHMLSGTLQTPR
jgi:predicted nucleic acid-binding Zn ribbon protein